MKIKVILHFFFSLLIATPLISCTQNQQIEQEIQNQNTEFTIEINTESRNNSHKNYHNNSPSQTRQAEETLLRADPRFIAWLEKTSLIRQAPNLLSVVSGNSLAWRAPSLLPEKNNILSHSPAWFYANPWKILVRETTHIGEFLTSKTSEHLKHIGINALFFAPSASFSLNQELNYEQAQTTIQYDDTAHSHDESQQTENSGKTPGETSGETSEEWMSTSLHAKERSFNHSPEYDIVAFGIDEQVATQADYKKLEQTNMLIGGNMLEPALGIGADFLLALRAVREYSGLFTMTELPQSLWKHIPQSHKQNTFAYTILDDKQKLFLAQSGIIPLTFARDLMPDTINNEEYMHTQSSGFAVTDPIRGVDSAKRRWVYRFANDPKRPLLNLSDPNMNAYKLFNASIIEQVGMLHQPLIGISIGDLWGQEATYLTQENSFDVNKIITENNVDKLNSYLQQFAEPALFSLSIWNKSIHNYGAWSLLNDAFPIEFIPLLLNEKTDFVADTIFMPALEDALIKANALALKTAAKRALALKIDCTSLWHASQDRYQKQIFQRYFKYSTSMQLASQISKIDRSEGKLIEKYLQAQIHSDKSRNSDKTVNLNNVSSELPKELANKLRMAKDIQFSFIAFQSLLPGLSFISAYDLQAIVPITTENNTISYPNYALTRKNTIGENTQSFMLNTYLENQINDNNSLLQKLKPLYDLKQKEQLSKARLVSVLETKDTVFAVLLQAPTHKYFILYINPTNTTQNAKTKIIPQDFVNTSHPNTQTRFTKAQDALGNMSKTVHNNSFAFSLAPFECRLFELR